MKESEIIAYMCRVGGRGSCGKIENTLRALQEYVGGGIQVFPLTQDLLLICNRDGKNLGLPVNRVITDGNGRVFDVVAGNALVVRVDGEEFASISEEDIPLIEKHFPSVRLSDDNVELLSAETLPEYGGS